jgi:hypothetical protein
LNVHQKIPPILYQQSCLLINRQEYDTPVTGDVTGQVTLWDAGTEVNQAPGFGPDQAPRQVGSNTGSAENGIVQIVADEFTYPDSSNIIRVIISVAP